MDKFMNGNIRFERNIAAPDGIHEDVERNGYRSTNVVALALVGASVIAAMVAVVIMAVI